MADTANILSSSEYIYLLICSFAWSDLYTDASGLSVGVWCDSVGHNLSDH